jgi:uncharacterized protein YdhG (YjbR/CyaY superfamily)
MQTDATIYIEKAPPEQQPALQELRALIRSTLPHAAETVDPNGLVVYSIQGRWVAGFASRKKGALFHLMLSDIVDRYGARLGKLRTGKSCIVYHPTKNMAADELRNLAAEMLTAAAQSLA